MFRVHPWSLAIVVATTACSGRQNVQCEQDSNCDLSGGGVCTLNAATGNHWCAYPDPECPSGYRYSDLDVGDDVGGKCVPAEDVSMAMLRVTVDGPGTVTSDPPGISCNSGTCSGSFPVGTKIRLVAAPMSLSFLGWSGACRGISDCMLTLNADASANAWFGNPGTALWVTRFGGALGDQGKAIARDSHDDLIVAGYFSGSVAFGSTTLASAGGFDIFVVKLAQADGAVVWAKRFGGTGEDLVTGLAVNEQDEIFLSGSINGPHDYGGGPLPHAGARDLMLLKLDAAGDFAWAKSFGTVGYDQATAVAARNGNVALAGYFNSGTLNFAGTMLASQGVDDIVVALFSSAGNLQWVKSFGGTSSDRPSTVRIDGAGNVVTAGEFQATVNFGMGQVASAGNTDAFLLKLATSTGNTLVAKRFGGTDADTAAAVECDSTDAMYLVGSFRSTVNFGTGDLTASQANNSDAYLVKLSAAGATAWAKQYGGAGNGRRATSVAVTLNNDVVFAGGFNGNLSLGGVTLSSASSADDVFLARAAAADGSYVSSTRAGGQGQESAQSVTQTSDGKYFVTGAFQGFADFGGAQLTSAGGDDAFVYGMAPL